MTERTRAAIIGGRRGALAAAAAFACLGVSLPSAAGAPPAPQTEDRYIVVLKDRVEHPGAVAAEQHRRYGVERTATYRSALTGYAARISAREVAALRRDPHVAYVEPDGIVRFAETIQKQPTWGLDRIDEPNLPVNGRFRYTRTGRGVTAYIIDSGLRPSHNEFGDRAVSDEDFVDPVDQGRRYRDGKDCNGHGTHVGGTVGGKTYGVAKRVSLVGVRVVDCHGFGLNSEVIAGVDWVTSDHRGDEDAVANMSLGGPRSAAVDTAVENSIEDGVSYAIAAGNGDFFGIEQDACGTSPARVPAAMTVGATTRSDRKAFFSNFGDCVDWFAPGVDITSAWKTSDSAKETISGTSMASPHTAGVAALYLDDDPGATPEEVGEALHDETIKDKVREARTRRNNLLHTRW